MTRRTGSQTRRPLVALGFLLTSALVLVAACSSSGGDHGNAGSSGGTSAAQAEADRIVAQATAPITKWPGPTSSPPSAKNKRVLFIPITLSAAGDVQWGDYIKLAAQHLGWTATVYPTDGEVSQFAAGLNEAVSGKYDAVIMSAITPSLVAPQLAKVRAAGIPVIDMSNNSTPSPTTVNYNIGTAVEPQAKYLAAYVAKASGGKASVAIFNFPESLTVVQRVDAFEHDLKTYCPSCQVSVTTNLSVAALDTPAMVSQVEGVLQAHPNVNYLYSAFDDFGINALQAVQQAGLSKKVKIVSLNANDMPMLQSLAAGGPVVADVGAPNQWLSFLAMDTLNRIFAGATNTITAAVTDSSPFRLFTRANLPSDYQTSFKNGWLGDYNFTKKYYQLWGVS